MAEVIDVPRPRMLILNSSGGYTHATHAHVKANIITYMYTNAIAAFDADLLSNVKLVFWVNESYTGLPSF